tara:strand:- start:10440 stop:11129 length:690 start_codon:yes stop_codon:yes gene_type:complete
MDDLSCIIIEDEPLAMERTLAFVNKVPFLSLKGTFDNALTGLTFLNQNDIDILFLDINMDELSGIELLENSRIQSEVIITTAYPQYALKGYELSITDYLLKPFTFERFLASINKVQEKISFRKSEDSPDFIFIKTENRLEKIHLHEILFIEGMRDYRRIHTGTKRIMTLQNFKDLEILIPKSLICRVHKSYMVSISKIDSIERSRIFIGKEVIPISDTYRESFFELIKA